ncbi:MAG: glycine cleavage system protein GcvH [Muribaculaceae bacterium]|nr:glycine cleavage system protein GcvH [Muribaculaceae bacterium]
MIKYLPTHEYIRIEGNEGYIGITAYAAKELGVVTYVDMPEEGDELTAGEEFGAIESRKAASDLFSPVSGEVLAVNEALEEDPTLINADPMTNWIVKVSIADHSELDALMDEAAYEASIK